MKHCLIALLFALVAPVAYSNVTIESGQYYTFRNLSSGLVLSNGSTMSKNARLAGEKFVADGDPAQQWQLNAVEGYDNVYQFVNTDFSLAIDLALTGSFAYPLQWSPNISNANQHVRVLPVEGTDDIVTIGTNGEVFKGQEVFIGDTYAEYIGYFSYVPDGDSQKAMWQIIPVEHKAYERPDWENEAVFAVGKEVGHATYLPYPDTKSLRADAARYEKPWLDPTDNGRWMSLDGTWKVTWQNGVADMPDMAALTASTTTPSGVRLSNVTVPGCLEMQGFSTPYYLNDNYPFEDAPPYIHMKSGVENGVASYRRTFTMPSDWAGERVYLHFDGIYGGAYIWLNGKKVGYSQGSNNDAEFDVTDFLKSGTNVLGVQNIRWTDGSYLEGQDMWHMSGIHRNVSLYALPEGSVRDHWFTATFADDFSSATLTTHLRGGHNVTVTLLSPEGTLLAQQTAEEQEDGTLAATFSVPQVQLWSAEYPVLYTVEVSQCDADGKEEMAFATKYGFRQIKNDGKLVYVNGKRVYFRGVNTQDTDPKTGRTMPLETMLQDIIMMKQANVNTVRTSHYPRSPRMMDMFDYYGLYVMDEADNECHHNWTDFGRDGLASQASWIPAMQDRTDRMVLRDRNHASVIFWSLGNESSGAVNFCSLYNAVKALDGESGRPVHYEGATRDGSAGQTDLYSQMYPTVDKVANYASSNNQPYFICEYAHAMGNAIGNLREYWSNIYGSKYGVGACIWDWVDQSIYDAADLKSGRLTTLGLPRFKSGFDYGYLHQDNFVNNGILTAERVPNGKLAGVKAVYAPVQLASYSAVNKSIRLKNVDSFTDLNTYDCRYAVLVNGVVVEEGSVELPSIAPQNISPLGVTIPYTTQPANASDEVLLNIYFMLREPTRWAEKGHVVATLQQVVQNRAIGLPTHNAATNEQLSLFQNGRSVSIGNSKFALTFDLDGSLTAYNCGGQDLIAEGPEYDNFRWIENDRGLNTSSGLGAKTAEFQLADDRLSATVQVEAEGTKCPYTLIYTIYADATFDITANMRPAANDLLRIGLGMTFPAGFENVSYWGRGPEENYWDRKDGCYIGRYRTTVTELFEHYPHPQTCGGREDIRELILSNDEGRGLRITTGHGNNREVAMQLLHYADSDMSASRIHPYDLTPADEVYAHFDTYQRGLGNGSCGQGTGTISAYKCPSGGVQSFSLRFSPYDAATDGLSPLRPQHPSSNSQLSTSYDLQGRSFVRAPQAGIYINGNNKYLNHK